MRALHRYRSDEANRRTPELTHETADLPNTVDTDKSARKCHNRSAQRQFYCMPLLLRSGDYRRRSPLSDVSAAAPQPGDYFRPPCEKRNMSPPPKKSCRTLGAARLAP